MPNGSPWPRISIVTPSYNQGQFLEETIRSVLLQGYPNLEYIIIDGGSTDNSVDIIRKYEPWLTYWVSEPDRGQSHAINKGLACATGQILTWLNSDDIYVENCLNMIGRHWREYPKTDFLLGDSILVDETGNTIGYMRGRFSYDQAGRWLSLESLVPQPSSFFSARAYAAYGPMDEDLHYAMDMDFWLRMAGAGACFSRIEAPLARFRRHEHAKSSAGDLPFLQELVAKYFRTDAHTRQPYPDKALMTDMCLALLSHYPLRQPRAYWGTFAKLAWLSPQAGAASLAAIGPRSARSIRSRMERALQTQK